MSILSSTPSVTEPHPRMWTRDEYHHMVAIGFFEGQRIELIDGEILEMSPQEALHFATLSKLQKILDREFGAEYWVRAQGPLKLGSRSEPEPDLAVVEGMIDDYADHPNSAVLVVEVSYSSLAFDRMEKTGLYAAAGIREYWIVNLVDCQLEVFRTPVASPTNRFGFEYSDKQILKHGEYITPLAIATHKIAISDFLP